MRPNGILFLILPAIWLTAGGCSSVNVEARDESQPPHEKIFREEMEGRAPDSQVPRVVELPEPQYPEPADPELAGMVMVRVLVGLDGQVYEAEVVQGVDPAIDMAALEAAREGKYAPASESGSAAERWITVPFRYPPPVGKTD